MTRILQHAFLVLITLASLHPALAGEERTLVVDTLAFEGNTKTKTQVIRNYLTIAEGQPVTRAQLAADEARLRATHFFKEVRLLALPAAEPGKVRIVVRITERKWPFLQFKSGFNELDGWYLSPLGVRFDNIFGRGNILGWELLIGDRVSGARLEFVRPFLFGSEYDFEVQVFGFEREFLHFRAGERFRQQIQNNGLMVRVRGNSGLAKFFSAAFVAENVIPDTFLTQKRNGDAPRFPLPGFLVVPGDTQKVRRVVLAATVDSRDQRIHPLRGWWGSVTLDQSTKQLGSFASFYRITVDVRRYQPLWKRLIVAARARWGTVSSSAPFYEKFYLGGPNSLRGYADRSLTPEGYAANIAQGSAELRFPLSRRSKNNRFSGVLFFDTGLGWNAPQKFDLDRLKSGIGYGLRVGLPIVGLLRVDFAYPLPANGNGDVRVHVSLGHTF